MFSIRKLKLVVRSKFKCEIARCRNSFICVLFNLHFIAFKISNSDAIRLPTMSDQVTPLKRKCKVKSTVKSISLAKLFIFRNVISSSS